MKLRLPLSSLGSVEKVILFGLLVALLFFPLVVLVTLQEKSRVGMEKSTLEISTVISRLRQYYATEIVGRIQDAGGKAVPTEDYKNVHGGIPIPATFSIEMGNIFDKARLESGVEYRFVSDFPFKGRTRPKLDDFQTRALEAFRNNAELEIFKESHVPLIGQGQHRLATPVRMEQACVYCHNTHPASTKRDWAANDIRGIQEVRAEALELNLFEFNYLFLYFILLGSLASGSFFVFNKSSTRLKKSNNELRIAREAEHEIANELSKKVGQLELLAAVADGSTFGVTIADCDQADRPLIYANDAFYRLTGFSKDQVIGQNCRFLSGDLTSQEARSNIRSAIEKGLPCTVELINYRLNGSTFWNRLTLFPVGGTVGKPKYYVGYQTDVTSIYEAQTERSQLMAEVQEGQKFESLGVLVAGVAHEINNPLGIALTATSYISQSAEAVRNNLEAKGLLNDEVKEFLEDEIEAFGLVETNLKRASLLVRNFKDVATDRSQKSMRVVDLKHYLETLSGSFAPLLRQSQCKLTIAAEENIRLVLDTGSFGQLITNLVVNAVVHAFDGIKSPQISVTLKRGGLGVALTVSDNGNGIPKAVLPNIFTPFFTTKRNTGGTGLGLFIAKRIAIEELNGDLTVANMAPGGATFYLTFPISEELNE